MRALVHVFPEVAFDTEKFGDLGKPKKNQKKEQTKNEKCITDTYYRWEKEKVVLELC